MLNPNGAFITGVDAGGQRATSSSSNRGDKRESVLPRRVINDHQKLTDVVDAFRSKVELMVDKQRVEYEEAYEFHMEGVQKELHFLREKAKEIANDKTKEEKINQLDSNQKFYSAESIRLDAETNELRKKLRTLAGTVHVVERERDWLLGKLRTAKSEYRTLSMERTRVMDQYGASLGGSTVSGDSSLTLELMRGSGSVATGKKKTAGLKRTSGSSLPPLGNDSDPLFNNQHVRGMSKLQKRLERDLHRSKSDLVGLKSRQEQLRKYVEGCHSDVTRGHWDKYFRSDAEQFTPSVTSAQPSHVGDGELLQKRPILEVLDDCSKAVSVEGQDGAHELRKMLAVELALIPETFEIILDMLSADPMRGANGMPEDAPVTFGAIDAEAIKDGVLYDVLGPVASSPDKLLAAAEEEWDEMRSQRADDGAGAGGDRGQVQANPWVDDEGVTLERDISTYLTLSVNHRRMRLEEEEEDMMRRAHAEGGMSTS